MSEVSLYFHIPFCSHKCPYCHFFVIPDKADLKKPFLEALLQEWALQLPLLQGKRIVSIYFGGGTPTKLSADSYALLLQTIQNSGIDLSPTCEITLEANPEDVTYDKMHALSQAGINRVSLGVQSLVDSELQTLQRTHSASRSLQAIHTVYQAGISNISIDLLFDLPSQTLHSLKKSLDPLKDLPLTHLSLYNLVLEPHTVFFKKSRSITPLLPSDEESTLLLQTAIETFSTLNLNRYEISAFSKPLYQSQHNRGYWTARPFLGFGPSAFSYWNKRRFSNTKRYQKYLLSLKRGELPVEFTEELDYPHNLHELFAVELRLLKGVHLPHFIHRHKEIPPTLKARWPSLLQQGLIEHADDHIRLTPKGLLFYDSVATDLI